MKRQTDEDKKGLKSQENIIPSTSVKYQPAATENTSESSDSDNNNDPDFDNYHKGRKHKRSKTVILEVPQNILKATALTSQRYKQSVRGQSMTLANLMNVSEGNVSDFSLSPMTACNQRKKVVIEKAEAVKSSF